jgi:hypothetical protein
MPASSSSSTAPTPDRTPRAAVGSTSATRSLRRSLIRALVEDQIERVERLTVVTSDLEVARHARAMGAGVSMADLFLASLLGPEAPAETEKPTTLSKRELEEWAEIFRSRRGSPPPEDES